MNVNIPTVSRATLFSQVVRTHACIEDLNSAPRTLIVTPACSAPLLACILHGLHFRTSGGRMLPTVALMLREYDLQYNVNERRYELHYENLIAPTALQYLITHVQYEFVSVTVTITIMLLIWSSAVRIAVRTTCNQRRTTIQPTVQYNSYNT